MKPYSQIQCDGNVKRAFPCVKRTPPYDCMVGDWTIEEGRIPDEYQIKLTNLSDISGSTVFELLEWYSESFEGYKKRKAQFETDKMTILKNCISASCDYDLGKGMSVIRIVQKGSRPEMVAGIFREMTVQAKYFLGEEKTEFIYENILVEGFEDE